jgi:phenylacetate-CoA ligase
LNSILSREVLKLHERITGRHILTRLEELIRTQWLSLDELIAIQRTKLISLLEYAYQYVPYYHRTFDEAGFQPDDARRDISNVSGIPILTKDIIRNNFGDLLTIEPKRLKQLSKLSTSGSTGNPLIFMEDSGFRDAVTADIQRHLGWAGLKVGDLHALIWGASFKPTLGKMLRTKLIDQVWNRFQINAFDMTDASMKVFAKRILSQKPRILFGYATSIYRFAQFVRHSPYSGMKFDGIFTSAETLLQPMREVIEETFQCYVFNRYGTLELGGVACECEAHVGMHISVENNFVKILHLDNPTAPGEVGDLIVTNLNNLGMPFIRYSIGDAASSVLNYHCSCGRESPRLLNLEGRIIDTFWTTNSHIAWSGFAGAAFHCLTHPSIQQFQVIQKTLYHMVIRLVPEGDVPQTTLEEIKQSVRMTFGEGIKIDFEFPQEISPLSSGKHCYAISELNRN